MLQVPVTALTWGHNDKRLFVATGCTVHMAWVSMRVASLQLLCSLQVYNRLGGSLRQLTTLPLPLRIQQLVSKLFSHTIRVSLHKQRIPILIGKFHVFFLVLGIILF